MNKLLLSLFATSYIFTLTACSSSSGGGGGNAPTYFTEKPTSTTGTTSGTSTVNNAATTNNTATDSTATTNNTTNNPITDSTATTDNTASPSVDNVVLLTSANSSLFQNSGDSRFTGGLVTIKNSGDVNGQNLKSYLGENLDTLMLNDVELPLLSVSADNDQDGFKAMSIAPSAESIGVTGGYTNKTASDYRDSRYYQFVRFGILNMNNQAVLFVQGLQTPVSGTVSDIENGYATLYAMPKSGKFTYNKGDALYGKDGQYQQLIANVTADFTNKQIDVSLKEAQTQSEKVAFSGKIDGNTFSANHNGVESKGAFYGSRANHVAGVFYKTSGTEKGYHGVFGATDKRVAQ